jgi:hypothetical protein
VSIGWALLPIFEPDPDGAPQGAFCIHSTKKGMRHRKCARAIVQGPLATLSDPQLLTAYSCSLLTAAHCLQPLTAYSCSLRYHPPGALKAVAGDGAFVRSGEYRLQVYQVRRKGPCYKVAHTTPHTTLRLNKNREALRQRKLLPGSMHLRVLYEPPGPTAVRQTLSGFAQNTGRADPTRAQGRPSAARQCHFLCLMTSPFLFKWRAV